MFIGPNSASSHRPPLRQCRREAYPKSLKSTPERPSLRTLRVRHHRLHAAEKRSSTSQRQQSPVSSWLLPSLSKSDTLLNIAEMRRERHPFHHNPERLLALAAISTACLIRHRGQQSFGAACHDWQPPRRSTHRIAATPLMGNCKPERTLTLQMQQKVQETPRHGEELHIFQQYRSFQSNS